MSQGTTRELQCSACSDAFDTLNAQFVSTRMLDEPVSQDLANLTTALHPRAVAKFAEHLQSDCAGKRCAGKCFRFGARRNAVKYLSTTNDGRNGKQATSKTLAQYRHV